jgi:hypothetical protein
LPALKCSEVPEGLKLVITKAVRLPIELAMHKAGMSEREISEKTGIPKSTVHRDLSAPHGALSPPETAPYGAEPVQTDIEEFTGAPVAVAEVGANGAIVTGSPSDDLDLPTSFAMLDLKDLSRAAKFRMLKVHPKDALGALTASSTGNEKLARHIRKISGPLAEWLKELSTL